MKIKIASPCSVRWEDMSGDERSRFCQHCQKHVYNFVAMTHDEIQTLIQQKEGKLCARIYQRRDGTILTSDCPVGLAGVYRRIKIMVCSAAAGLALSFAALDAAQPLDEMDRIRTRIRTVAMWDNAVSTVKEWFGVQPPPPVAGATMVVPASTSCPTNLFLLGDVASQVVKTNTGRPSSD